MKIAHPLRLLFLGALLTAMLSACGFGGGGGPAIAAARLAKDSAGTQATTTFAPEDTFYLIVDLDGAPDDTTVKAQWTAVAVPDAAANTVLDDVELTSGTDTLTFDLSNATPWPAGEYKVDLFLNGAVERTLTFRVSAGLAQTGSTGEPAATAESGTVAEPAGTAGPVSTLDAVKSATIQIEAQGSFVDPEVGAVYNAAGRGSGFIIDPSGIAVTNNHVVTGAALIKVWVGGEKDPRNARVLGVSECADLAVIDIDGDGYPFLGWYDGTTSVGLDVYAAGFPLGDPEFTLTRGIVSKARAGGETSWASVDDVIEHDATINPGNSGGPLITTDGRLVGVNYAGSSSTNQYFAIAEAQAVPVIDQLRQGGDYLSIGVNGTAVNDGAGLSGIWVSSVKSGSPADRVGVTGGDIITRLEGLVLATDGTMSDYCDILRTHNATDTLALEVLRFSTQEVLAGSLNGRELEQTFSFAQELGGEVDDSAGAGATAGGAYADYVTVTDDTGALVLDVPAAWGQVSGGPWVVEDTAIGQSVTAAPNIDDYQNTWSTPGVFFGASDQINISISELLDAYDYGDSCTYSGRTDYADPVYTGQYDVWSNCGGTDSLLVVLSAQPEDQSYLVLVMVQAVTDADLDALDRILNTFIVSSN